ncbi:hypothetical protein TEA_013622 [Camellia sinensis var. sinensis]|uniref:Uncharacterized protein n=1 Tax=Camellia sinensis var. sinensis TaxID=542762 RepID=A0A4S4DNW8_CAMSN|nr:hypothetical protein TEA_013622 [Camellia sinensis var. sinensis]
MNVLKFLKLVFGQLSAYQNRPLHEEMRKRGFVPFAVAARDDRCFCPYRANRHSFVGTSKPLISVLAFLFLSFDNDDEIMFWMTIFSCDSPRSEGLSKPQRIHGQGRAGQGREEGNEARRQRVYRSFNYLFTMVLVLQSWSLEHNLPDCPFASPKAAVDFFDDKLLLDPPFCWWLMVVACWSAGLLRLPPSWLMLARLGLLLLQCCCEVAVTRCWSAG